MDEGISFIVGVEFVFTAVTAVGGRVLEGLGDAAVEALHHAVGLRVEGLGELVLDALGGADLVEGVAFEGLTFGLADHIDGEAIGELGAIIGEDGVDGMAEGFQEAFEAGGDGRGIAAGDDFA
jgi:hypothetical protein